MFKRRRQQTEALLVSAIRRGRLDYWDVYTPLEAARKASELARQGWTVEVTKKPSWGGSGASRRKPPIMMYCMPVTSKHNKPVARCKIRPAFKRRIKGYK